MKRRRVVALLIATSVICGGVGIYSASLVSKLNVEACEVYEDPVDEIVDATEKMKEEEEYVANLVSSQIGQDITVYDWEECLSYLEKNYKKLEDDKNVDIDKVKSYMDGYKAVREEKEENLGEEVVNKKIITRAEGNNYNAKKVTAYTDKWWDSFNPDYPKFPADCANFVSQAIYAGGMPMIGSSYGNAEHWFCKTKKASELEKVSLSWRTASGFSKFWRKNAVGYRDFDRSFFDSKEKFKKVYNYGSVGDPINLINYNDRVYHTLIVSYKKESALKCAAHTRPHKWKSIYNLVNETDPAKVTINKVRIFNMK